MEDLEHIQLYQEDMKCHPLLFITQAFTFKFTDLDLSSNMILRDLNSGLGTYWVIPAPDEHKRWERCLPGVLEEDFHDYMLPNFSVHDINFHWKRLLTCGFPWADLKATVESASKKGLLGYLDRLSWESCDLYYEHQMKNLRTEGRETAGEPLHEDYPEEETEDQRAARIACEVSDHRCFLKECLTWMIAVDLRWRFPATTGKL